MLKVGLTGSIAMGKSTAAAAFAAEGLPVFNADRAVHELYRGPAARLVEAAFPGTNGPTGIDRQKLADKVLGDDAALSRLESIIHPLVRKAEADFLGAMAAKGESLVVLDLPLLFEMGEAERLDVIVVVGAPLSIQLQRLESRPGMTPARIAALLARQTPDEEKRRRAHFLLDSSRSLEASRRQIKDLLRALRAAAIAH